MLAGMQDSQQTQCRCGRRLVHYGADPAVCTYCKSVSRYCTCQPLQDQGYSVRVRPGPVLGRDDLVMLAHDGGYNYYVVTVPELATRPDPMAAVLSAYGRLENALGMQL